MTCYQAHQSLNFPSTKSQRCCCRPVELFFVDKSLTYRQLFASIHVLLLFLSFHSRMCSLIHMWDIPPISGWSTPSLASPSAVSLALSSMCPGMRSNSTAGPWQGCSACCDITEYTLTLWFCRAVRVALLLEHICTLLGLPSRASCLNFANMKYPTIRVSEWNTFFELEQSNDEEIIENNCANLGHSWMDILHETLRNYETEDINYTSIETASV